MGKPWVGDALASLGKDLWRLNKWLHGDYLGPNFAEDIMTIWKRNNVCIKEGETELYPKLVDEDEDEYGNPRYYYKLPKGLSFKKIRDNNMALSCYFKADVVFKMTDHHPKAHFRLTIPLGKVYDRIDLVGIKEFLKEEFANAQGVPQTVSPTP